MSDFAEIPLNLPLFEGVPPEKVLHVLKCLNATIATFESKERILAQGEKGKYALYLLSGNAFILSNDCWGNRSILGGVQAWVRHCGRAVLRARLREPGRRRCR